MGSRRKTSSRQSSSNSTPPDDPVYLADHCLGGRLIVDRMKSVGETVYRPRRAVLNSKIVVFLAPGGKSLTGEMVADAIVRARHRMRQWLLKYDRPFIARISPDGRLTMVDDFHADER